MPWILTQKGPWIVTEKIDGTSSTFAVKKSNNPFKKNQYYVCSRNVVFDTPDKSCYYDSNVYIVRYNMEKVLTDIVNELNVDWVIIQGEIFGRKIQNRDYSMNDIDFRAFNFVTPDGRWGSVEASEYLNSFNIPFVPILDTEYYLPDTVDELLEYAEGNSEIDNLEREGLVIRSKDGKQSFKAVANNFLIKYHGKD